MRPLSHSLLPAVPAKRQGKHVPFLLTLAVFLALVVVGMLLNGPVGNPTVLEGTTTQLCVPQGRSNATFICSVRLQDGSTQVFVSTSPLDMNAPVSFSRSDRRIIGAYYERRN